MSDDQCEIQQARGKMADRTKSSSEKPTLNTQAQERQHLTPALPPERRGSAPAEESFITKEVVAQRLCVTPETVRRWASDGRLPSHHFGRRLRFKWSEVEAALMKQK